ncbi:MAG: NfeD family protein [Verrucomicrobia bacterium]|nr:NfeD family protein [Verrucomicrobiota bacterium]
MDTPVLVLFAAGLVLLGFEVVVPGAILGALGGLFLLGGVALAFAQHGVEGGLLALGVALVAVVALMYFEFRILPRTRIGKRMFLKASIDATSQPAVAVGETVMGKEARAVTALSPTGLVEIEGRRYEARCDSGFADEGARLRVVRVESFQLVVMAEVAL